MTGKIFEAIRIIAIFLAAGMSLSAHAGLFGFGGDSWKEEALQPDGSTIIVERTVEHGGRHEIGQEPPYKWQRLRFTIPATGEVVTWEDNYSDDVGSANFNPLLLVVFGKTAYVLNSPVNIQSLSKWGCQNPPYVIFRFQNEQWKQVPIQDLPIEVKVPNLVISSPDDVAKNAHNGVLSVEMIRMANSGFHQPEFQSIIRKPFAKSGGCLVPIKGGGWESPGGIKRMIPIVPKDERKHN